MQSGGSPRARSGNSCRRASVFYLCCLQVPPSLCLLIDGFWRTSLVINAPAFAQQRLYLSGVGCCQRFCSAVHALQLLICAASIRLRSAMVIVCFRASDVCSVCAYWCHALSKEDCPLLLKLLGAVESPPLSRLLTRRHLRSLVWTGNLILQLIYLRWSS